MDRIMRGTQIVSGLAVLACLIHTDLAAQPISRDSLRVELQSAIDVLRVPTGTDSIWVVAVPKMIARDLAIGRFSSENPFFLTYLLENAPTFRFGDVLDAVPQGENASELYRRLAADAPFMGPLHDAVNGFLGAERSIQVAPRDQLSAEEIISFASRFVRLDVDPDGLPSLTLCAKSSDIRERPFESTIAFEAWIYSMIRPGLEDGALGEVWSIAREIAVAAAPVLREDLMAIQREIWHHVSNVDVFRTYVLSEVERRREYLPFEVRP
jgi:hypothetical protein